MEAEPAGFNVEDLLAQASWLGALARRLVNDQALADDIVQNTWLAALRQPPEPERPLRPWLARVARNFARQARRSEDSRRAREVRSARERDELTTRDPSPEELVGRLEGQRLLVEALKGLAEPYRSTVLLHYFEHRTLAEIARGQGLPEGTVRWRLKHGLDDLRARLDHSHGEDRSAWVLALLPLVRHGTPIGAATLPLAMQGVISMSVIWKLCALAAGMLILFAALALCGVLPLPMFPARNTPAPETVQFRALEPNPVLKAQPNAAESSRASAQTIAPDPANAAPEGRVAARFLDPVGRPIVHVGVRCEQRLLDPEPESTADGRVEFPFAPIDGGVPASFVVHAEGWATRRLSALIDAQRTTHLGDIELAPGGAVSGRVQDEHGNPIAGVELEATTEIRSREEAELRRYSLYSEGAVVRSVSAGDGSFRLDGAAAGFAQVVASSPGKLKTFSGLVEVHAGQESQGLVLVMREMPADEIIRGIVLDPQRAPVPRAQVEYRTHGGPGDGSGSFRAGADGRFSLVARTGSSSDLMAKDPATRFAPARAKDVHGGTNLELVFEPAREIEIVARSRDGSPLQNLRAKTIEPSTSSPNPRALTVSSGFSDPSEAARTGNSVRLPIPGDDFVVQVEAEGHRVWQSASMLAEKSPMKLDIVLDRMPCLRGRVFSNSAVVPGARITAWSEVRERMIHDGYPIRVNPGSIAGTTSNAEGVFVLTVRQKDRIYVRVEAEGFAPFERGPIDYDPAVGLDGADAHLSQGGMIEGRVIAARGRSPAGTIVAFSRGDAHEFTLRVGEDGRFAAQHLIPGRWLVTKTAAEVNNQGHVTRMESRPPDDIPWSCEVADGRTTHFDVDLTDGNNTFELTGALTIDGGPPGAWQVDLHEGVDLPSTSYSKATLDPSGSFSLAVPGLGTHRLVFSGLDGRTAGMRPTAIVEVREKRTNWSRDLRTAELVVEGLDRVCKGGAFVAVVSVGAEDLYGLQGFGSPNSASVSTLTVLVGTARIVRFDEADMGPDPRLWKALAEIEVVPGKTTRLRLP